MKHIGLTAAGVLSVITAATAFLCVGTGTGVAEEAAPVVPMQAAVAQSRDEGVVLSHAVFAGESVPFGPRSQRHAFDALQVAEELGGEDMGWQYVQLRL
ncbi:hypothetical protein [Cupriavidus sp. AU9028]|uniref:hypothetical protein n=1 Tax=Cupriavidus sp. AU9028 TaxID=2871157 RepID=UPI001C9453FB|nr:hypothetical protein [Cupriavidus sp. AU9028]MBY4896692.1 hypothetical protein [Cupriavidus sp. AU9028]